MQVLVKCHQYLSQLMRLEVSQVAFDRQFSACLTPIATKSHLSPSSGFASKVGFARALFTFLTSKTVNFDLIFDF
jgi:hypothetical protein